MIVAVLFAVPVQAQLMRHSYFLKTKLRVKSHVQATTFWRKNDISASKLIFVLIFRTMAAISLSVFRASTFTLVIQFYVSCKAASIFIMPSISVLHLSWKNFEAIFRSKTLSIFPVSFPFSDKDLHTITHGGLRNRLWTVKIFYNCCFRFIPVKSCGPKQATIIRLISVDNTDQSQTCNWSMALRNEDSEYMDKIYEPGCLLQENSVMVF